MLIAAALLAFGVALLLVSASSRPAGAVAPGVTERVSIDSNEAQLPAGGDDPSISAGGRFVAFATQESVDPLDDNGSSDVYVRDRVAGTTTLVSLGFAVLPVPTPIAGPCALALIPTVRASANGRSSNPSISADGRFVTFESDGCNLVASDANGGLTDVFLADRGEPAPDGSYGGQPRITLVSLFGPPGAESQDLGESSFAPSISGNGTNIAFTRGLDGPGSEVYVRNRDRNGDGVFYEALDEESVRVNPSSRFFEVQVEGEPAISSDGSHVTYLGNVSYSSVDGTPIPSGGPDPSDPPPVVRPTVLVYDRNTNTHYLVNPGQALALTDNFLGADPTISGDGAVVAYAFKRGLLRQVFVATRIDADGDGAFDPSAITLFSRASNGAEGDGDSFTPFVSTDGRYVAFTTRAGNLAGPRGSGCGSYGQVVCEAVLIGDRLEAGGTVVELVSVPVATPGGPSDQEGHSNQPAVNANGRFIAFASQAPSMIADGTDSNDVVDAFVRELTPGLVGAPNPLDFGMGEVGTPSPPLSIAFSHSGFGPLGVSGVAVVGGDQGDFEVFPTELCTGAILHRGGNCLVSVRFRPSALGPRSSELVVSYGGPNRTTVTAAVRLTGGGANPPVPIFQAQPNPVDFGELLVAATSPPQVVTVTNVGIPALSVPTFTVTSVTMTGANPGDFSVVASTCNGTTLAPQATCTVTVTFTPTAPGARTAVLQFADTAPGAPHLVALQGRAPAPLVSVDPALGVPGTVVNVIGQNWPVGSQVTLVFDGPPSTEQVVPASAVSATGRFVSPLLVLPRTHAGAKLLTARTTLPPPTGTLTATTGFLATIPSVDGGNDFVFRR